MISVVIPTHNRSDLIERAVNSVLNQTYEDIEIVVVSDGSSDDTANVVNSMTKLDSRIKFFEYHPAKGGNYARNKGIQESIGDYVAFLDDDDEWVQNKLEKQMSIFNRNNNIGLVYTGVQTIYVNESIVYNTLPKKQGDLSKDILNRNYIGTTSSVIVKKSIFDKAGIFDENLGAQQDYDLWIRICQITEIGAVNEVCVKYYNYTNTNQISAQIDKYINSMKSIEIKYENLFESFSSNQYKEKQSNNHLFLSLKALRNNNGKEARTYAYKSFNIKPSMKSLVYILASFTNYTTVLKIRSKFKKR